MPELVLKLGDNVIQTYVFEKDIMSVGRSRDNDIVIENLSVSRNHCRIRNQNGKFILTDLNSANGTFVNGVKITKTEVVDSDVISVGKHRLHFQSRVVPEEQVVADALGQDRTMFVDRAPQPVLAVTDGKLKGTEFMLTKFETAVGKAQENDIVIGDDWFLSKKQAVIYKRGSLYEIHDLGGFRKTKVNGQPLNEPRMLEPGDVIELGNTRCVFQFAGEPMPTGRVPQEMAPEDSIFSSGLGSHAEVAALASAPPQPVTHREEIEEYQVVVEGPSGEIGPNAQPEPDTALPVAESHSAPEAGAAPPDPGPEQVRKPVSAAPQSGGSNNPRRRKRDRLREMAGAAANQGGNGASVYGGDEQDASAPAEAPGMETTPSAAVAEEVPASSGSPEAQPASASEVPAQRLSDDGAAAGRWTGGLTNEEIADNPDLQREVALWEQAIQNRSAVIRRQAAKTLKKLTGRDYEL